MTVRLKFTTLIGLMLLTFVAALLGLQEMARRTEAQEMAWQRQTR